MASEKRKDPVEIEQELHKVGSYLAQKIADLNRASSKKKKKIQDKDLEEPNVAEDADATKLSDESDSDEDEEESERQEEKTESGEKNDSSSSDETTESDD